MGNNMETTIMGYISFRVPGFRILLGVEIQNP